MNEVEEHIISSRENSHRTGNYPGYKLESGDIKYKKERLRDIEDRTKV